MPTDILDGWVTVSLLDDKAPRVISSGLRPRGWKKVDSAYRGAQRATILEALRMVRGGCAEHARPIYGIDGNPTALQVWVGGDRPPVSMPDVGVWHFDMRNRDLPPVITATAAGVRVMSCAQPADRSVFGMRDVTGAAVRLDEMQYAIDAIYNRANQPAIALRLTCIDLDTAGERSEHSFHDLHIAGRYTDTGVLAHVWRANLSDDRARYLGGEVTAWAGLLESSETRYAAVADVRFLRAPHVVRWLGMRIPGLQLGLSEGTALAISPEDHARIARDVANLRANGAARVPTRLRLVDGDYREAVVTGRMISPNFATLVFDLDEKAPSLAHSDAESCLL